MFDEQIKGTLMAVLSRLIHLSSSHSLRSTGLNCTLDNLASQPDRERFRFVSSQYQPGLLGTLLLRTAGTSHSQVEAQ